VLGPEPPRRSVIDFAQQIVDSYHKQSLLPSSTKRTGEDICKSSGIGYN
jgi:hypothetical protein